jgi:hypothetical protein
MTQESNDDYKRGMHDAKFDNICEGAAEAAKFLILLIPRAIKKGASLFSPDSNKKLDNK